VLVLCGYNEHFFGSPCASGYEAALGPAGVLGLGVDPWGNRWGSFRRSRTRPRS
jgi:hypothetical protein